MPSICKCKFTNCPKAKECYRFIFESNPDTVEINYKYMCNEKVGYGWFWKIEEKSTEIIEKKDDAENGKEKNETGENT